MAGTIAFAICSTVALYESSTREKGNHARLLRLLSGWANVSNSFIHVLLTIYMLSNAANESEYWIEVRKLGGIEGPVERPLSLDPSTLTWKPTIRGPVQTNGSLTLHTLCIGPIESPCGNICL